MKLQLEISGKEKIVRIDEPTNVGDLYDFLQAHFPDNRWREFKLELKTFVQWQNPIVIKIVETQPIYYDPWVQPWWLYQPTIICGGDNSGFESYEVKEGTWCLQVDCK